MTDTLYTQTVREPQKRARQQQSSGICQHCGIGVTFAPARYCPFCIDRAARLFKAYALAGEAHRFHMGRLHVARYEWREIPELEVAV